MRKLLFLAIAATPLALAAPAFASDDEVSCPELAADEWLPMGEIEAKLTGMGYQVREIERERNCYEVEGTDANGAAFEAYVNPKTGEIVPRRERQRS
jgi:hypothetical protein